MSLAGLKVEVAWGDDPHAVSPTWVDIAGDVVSLSATTSKRTSEFDGFAAGRASIIVEDSSGNYDPTNGSGAYVNDFKWGTPLRISGLEAPSTWHVLWQGYCTLFTPIPNPGAPRTRIQGYDGLGLLADWNLPVVAATGEGDSSDTRIGDTLDAANWPSGDRDLEISTSAMAATTRGKSALAELQAAALADGGFVYHQPADNTITFDGRHSIQTRTRQASSQESLGGAAEVNVAANSLRIAGVGNTYRNIVRVTDAATTVYTAGSVTSTQAEKAVARTVDVRFGGQQLANYWLDLYDTEYPAPVEWVTVARIGDVDIDSGVFAVRLRDRVNVEWTRPIAGGGENFDVLIAGITYRVENAVFSATFYTEPADAFDNLTGSGNWLVLDTDTLDGTAVLGY